MPPHRFNALYRLLYHTFIGDYKKFYKIPEFFCKPHKMDMEITDNLPGKGAAAGCEERAGRV